MSEQDYLPARRVLIGVDAAGASAVESDISAPETRLENGVLLQELWQQRAIPAAAEDKPEEDWTLGPAAPAVGLVVRVLTVPASSGKALPEEADLHSDPSLHVITILEGELDIVLEMGVVTLCATETIVLRNSQHDLRNRQPRVARFVYTSVPISEPTVFRHERLRAGSLTASE